MRKLLILALSVISLTIVAQVPQGVGYQGVATDANGIELVNQSISIRASVLSGSANGTIEWEETHATSTDTFGLFTLTIGQGTNTTNGLQTSFADISWGTNTYFLKIEMDVTGGSTYSFMGTNQMMSVPYALYAESANINYDSISNFLSGDSTFITNVGGGMGGSGCDILFPDGLDGEPIHWSFDYQGSYTVPTGKTLYMLKEVNWDGTIIVNGITSNITVYWNSPLIIGENSIIDDTPGDGSFYGFLVDKIVTPITWSFTQGNYTVPSGKILYMLKESSWNGIITVNGFTYQTGLEIGKPLIIGENGIIDAGSGFGSFNGYLVDENYFAGCGGGGSSSSTSTLDSTAIANMIAAAGGGCNYAFPDGLNGDPVVIDLLSGNYTVPLGKNFYIINPFRMNADYFLLINGVKVMNVVTNTDYQVAPIPYIVKSGDIISYYVPSGSVTDAVLSGYLADENYFANCGGGGSSSTTTSSNSVGDFSYPDGKEDITPITYFSGIYTPPNNKNLYITSVISNLQISSNSIFTGQGNLGTGQGNAIGHPDLPIIVSETDVVDGDFNGFLVDAIVDPITMMLTGAGTYTVPSDKILVILNVHSYYGSLKADGNNLLSGYFNYYGSISGCSPTCFPKNLKAPIFVDENTLLTAGSGNGLPNSGIITFNGYLMDK